MQLNKEQIKELSPGLKIRKKLTLIDQQLTYLFFLDVLQLNIIDFQSDFTGSLNISLKNMTSHDFKVFKTVEPRVLTLVAQLQLHQNWKLVSKFKFRRRPISKEKQLQYLNSQIDSIKSERQLVQTILKPIDVNLTSLEQVNKILQKSKIRFIDNDFPPEDISIVGQSDKTLIDDTVNHWRRPQDIYTEYQLIGRLSYENLQRGKLGDNSFFSVVVCLALKRQQQLQSLFLGQTVPNPHGIYKIKICKNGQWQTVIIDDLLPCEPLSLPKFISSRRPQIWMCLLQKAYAKLHGRYLSLHDLDISSVFYDLTGCPTYVYRLTDAAFRKQMLQMHKNKCIVVFYDTDEKQFDQDQFIPIKNYAYPLLSTIEDDSKLYYCILVQTSEKKELAEKELSEEELMRKFTYACVCHSKNWQQVRTKGKFVTVEGGRQAEESYPISLSERYYSLDLLQKSQVHICLHQEDVLIGNNAMFKPYVYCSMLLLEKTDKSLLKPLQILKYSRNRQIQMKFDLSAGVYLIIPFIHSEAAIKKPPQQEDQIQDIFKKLDVLSHRQLKYSTLKPFFNVCKQVFDEQIFNGYLKTYARGRKGIGLLGFKAMWAKYKIYWKDCEEHYEKQRTFMLTIHSSIECTILTKFNIGTEFNNRAHCQLISKLGQDLSEKKYEKIAKVLHFTSKSNIIEYMIQNKHDRKIKVELDCSQSEGYDKFPKSGKYTTVLESGQKEFIIKMIPFQKCQMKDLKRVQKLQIIHID